MEDKLYRLWVPSKEVSKESVPKLSQLLQKDFDSQSQESCVQVLMLIRKTPSIQQKLRCSSGLLWSHKQVRQHPRPKGRSGAGPKNGSFIPLLPLKSSDFIPVIGMGAETTLSPSHPSAADPPPPVEGKSMGRRSRWEPGGGDRGGRKESASYTSAWRTISQKELVLFIFWRGTRQACCRDWESFVSQRSIGKVSVYFQ